MRLSKAGPFLWLSVLLFSANLQAEQTKPTTSRLTFEGGLDSSNSTEAYADLDLGLDNGMHLRGLYGKSWLEYTGDSLQNTSWLVGVSSDYAAPFVGGFDYEYWGNSDLLEIRTSRFKLGTNTDDWYLQLNYESRQSRLATEDGSTQPGGGKQAQLSGAYEVDSQGYGVDVSYYGWYPWALNLAYMRYSYDRDVTVLATNDRLAQRFSFPTLGMATSLETWRRSVDLSYNFIWGGIGVSGSQSESAVDQSISSTASVYGIWDLHRSWSLTLTGGQYWTDGPSETITYGRAAISHRW